MPTYEFRCPKGHDFEKFYRSIAAAPHEVQCPTCGLMAERRMSAGAGLVFKGSGFYITDYGKDGKKPQTSGTPAKDAPATGGSSEAHGTSPAPAKSENASAPASPSSENPKASSTAKPDQKPASPGSKSKE